MFYLYFRTIQCLIYGFFGNKIHPSSVTRRTFFCNFFDTDWFNGMQSGAFFSYTDASRWEVAIRCGFFWPSLKKGWVIIVAGQRVIYRRRLAIFRKFILETQIVGCDDKWIYQVQKFKQKGDTKCIVFSKLGIRAQAKLFSPRQVIQDLGIIDMPLPPLYITQAFSDDLKLYEQAH